MTYRIKPEDVIDHWYGRNLVHNYDYLFCRLKDGGQILVPQNVSGLTAIGRLPNDNTDKEFTHFYVNDTLVWEMDEPKEPQPKLRAYCTVLYDGNNAITNYHTAMNEDELRYFYGTRFDGYFEILKIVDVTEQYPIDLADLTDKLTTAKIDDVSIRLITSIIMNAYDNV
jgi:hypothetical protein